MKSNASQHQTIRAYLLGQLPGEQESQFEERLLTDDDIFEELEIVEDELVDEFLRAELTDEDGQSFKSHFMASPEHHEKLSFARAFRKALTTNAELPSQAPVLTTPSIKPTVEDTSTQEARDGRVPNPKKSWFEFFGMRNPVLGYATAAALVLIIVGISWVVWRRATAPRDPGRVHSVVLASGLTRDDGEGATSVRIPPDTDTVRLQLLIPESRHTSYEATLVDSETVELTTKSDLSTEAVDDQRVVIFDVPANLVPPGDYRVKLNGARSDGRVDSVASFSFRTAK